jgi:adenylate cyclase
VVTGAIGSTKALQYTAIGDPMNVASRLVDVANAGEIILSEHTYRAVADRVAAEALPPVRVKGKADELKVHRVLGMRPAKNLRGDSPLEGG